MHLHGFVVQLTGYQKILSGENVFNVCYQNEINYMRRVWKSRVLLATVYAYLPIHFNHEEIQTQA